MSVSVNELSEQDANLLFQDWGITAQFSECIENVVEGEAPSTTERTLEVPVILKPEDVKRVGATHANLSVTQVQLLVRHSDVQSFHDIHRVSIQCCGQEYLVRLVKKIGGAHLIMLTCVEQA